MEDPVSENGWLERHRRLLLLGGVVVILLVAGFLYLTGGRFVSTDNAYVRAARVAVSASVSGRVTQIDVHDNQDVHQGQTLFSLDDRDYVIAVNNAKAELASAKLRIAALKATYRQHLAVVQAARDTQTYLAHELVRQKKITAQGVSSQEKLEQAQYALQDAGQKLNEAEQAQANIRASLGNDPAINIDKHPDVEEAQDELDRAELNLSYTVIKAPMDGIVSKVDQLQVGAYIHAAAPVFALTSDKNVWVEANFKETDLTYLHPGQSVSIRIDAYPDRKFRGHLASLSSGTGASFSLLPAENATGNWVKVVQRLPVRISIDDFDPKYPLQTGLSAVVDVDTHHSRIKGLW